MLYLWRRAQCGLLGGELMRRETEIYNVKMRDKVSYAEEGKRVEQTRVNGRNISGEVATGKV